MTVPIRLDACAKHYGATQVLEPLDLAIEAGETVVLPNCRPGIVAGSLSVVTLSIGEFNLTWLLHTPLTQTLPVGLADAYASLRLEIGSAYTLVFFVLIVPLLVALQRAGGPR